MGLLTVIIVTTVFVLSFIRILSEWERGIILRLGRCIGVKGPGLIIVIPIIDKIVRVDTRTITMDIPPQDVITKDNVSLKVNAVVYFHVMNPEASVLQIEDYFFATSQLSQTTLRSVLGQYTLDDLLSSRDKINQTLREILDRETEPWGIKVTTVEVKHIDLPREMQRAMAKEAEAERERRAKIIGAQGELERSEKLFEASEQLSKSPMSLNLAYLQSLGEITGEGKNTIILPLPLDLVKPFLEKSSDKNV